MLLQSLVKYQVTYKVIECEEYTLHIILLKICYRDLSHI